MNDDVIALLGGLGNQLFQVTFASWLERETGREARYDISFSRKGKLNVLEVPVLGEEVRDRLIRATRLWPTTDGRLAGVGRAIRRLRGPSRIVSDYSSAGPTSPTRGKAAWWFGYWQRLEYARPHVSRLREALEIPDPPESDPVVGVHVRRRDMLLTGGSVTEDWFESALSRLPVELARARVRVWSDDPEWCRAELQLGAPFEVAADGPPVEHLRALAGCNALVISRSTFSWWAAAIASSRDAPVAFPTPWWPDSPDLESVVIPSGWIRVPERPGPEPRLS